MTIKELIKTLQEVEETEGDFDIFVLTPDRDKTTPWYDIKGITLPVSNGQHRQCYVLIREKNEED